MPGGAEVNTTLPVPDGKYEGWIIPEEALADAVEVRIDPSSVEGDALEAWRNAIDTNAKWLGERAFVDDLWVKDPIVVSELFAVGPRWLGEGGDIYRGADATPSERLAPQDQRRLPSDKAARTNDRA